MTNFKAQRERSKFYEIAFSNWLQKRGYFILPAYDYSGLSDNKAPRLMQSRDGLVVPDLFGARGGHTFWWEIKLKEHADVYRKTNTRVTGLALRHLMDYRRVKATTGSPVWLVFVHEAEDAVVTAELDMIQPFVSHTYTGNKMDRGGTVFLKFDYLTRLMTVNALKQYGEALKRGA